MWNAAKIGGQISYGHGYWNKMPNILKHFFAETKMSMSNYTRDEFPNRDFVKFDSKLFEYVLLAVNNWVWFDNSLEDPIIQNANADVIT